MNTSKTIGLILAFLEANGVPSNILIEVSEYLGDGNTQSLEDGNWKIEIVGDFLKFFRRETGTWVERASFGSSVTTDRFIIEDTAGSVVFIDSLGGTNTLLKPSIDEVGAVLGNPTGRVALIHNGELFSVEFDDTTILEDQVQTSTAQFETGTDFEYEFVTTRVESLITGEISLANIPVGTTARVSLLSTDDVLLTENVSEFDFNQGNGEPVSNGLNEIPLRESLALSQGFNFKVRLQLSNSGDIQGDIVDLGDGLGTRFVSYLVIDYYLGEQQNIITNKDDNTSGFDFVLDEDNLGSNSDTKVATQQSIKAYVDNKVTSGMTYKGGYDASTNTPNLEIAPTGVVIGDFYTVTVAGTFFSKDVEIGDALIAEIDDPSVEGDWTILLRHLDAVSIKNLYESNPDTNAFTDSYQSQVDANTLKVTNATHTGEVTGATGLTVNPTAISNKPLAEASGDMEILVNDAGTLKKINASEFTDGDDETKEPTGFLLDSTTGEIDLTSSELLFVNGTRTFTIQPKAPETEFSVIQNGKKYTFSSAQNIVIDDTEGMHFYTLTDGVLTKTTMFDANIIYSKVFITAIYWDKTNQQQIYFGEERHGCKMDGHTHARIHQGDGTLYLFGLGLNAFNIGNGDLNIHAQFGADSGQIKDEDILLDLSSIASTVGLPVYYKLGASGDWRREFNSGYSVLNSGTVDDRLVWNEFTGGAWQKTEVTQGDFVLCHIFATNDIDYPFISVMGQNEYGNVSSARQGAIDEINTLITEGLPFAEFVAVGTVIFQTRTTYANAINARIVQTDTGEDYVDWRGRGISPSGGLNVNHNSLAGLQGGAVDEYYHLTLAQQTGLTDGGETTLHSHPNGDAGGFTLHFDANDAIYNINHRATASSRNGHPIIKFSDADADGVTFGDTIPNAYGAETITVDIDWVAETATSGAVSWFVSFEHNAPNDNDIDSDSYATAKSGTSTTNVTNGKITRTSITFTQVEADGVTANDHFRLKLIRDPADVGDTMSGDAELLKISVRV